MSIEQPNLEASIEKESVSNELWLVDDDGNFTRSALRYWKTLISPNLCWRSFCTARAALDELQSLVDRGEPTPKLIISDGNLYGDEGDLQKGSNFVASVRSMPGLTQPTILAHSASERMNQEMLAAGVDQAFVKTKDSEQLEAFLVGFS